MKLCSKCAYFLYDYPERMAEWNRGFVKAVGQAWSFCGPSFIDSIDPPPFYTPPLCARTDAVFGTGDGATTRPCNDERAGNQGSESCGPDGRFWTEFR